VFRKTTVMFLAVAAVLSPVLSWAEEEGQAITEAPPVSEGQAPSSGAPEAAAVAEASHEEDYLIGPGDALDISVWKDEALTRSCVVRPDGMISFPLLGELRAADRTLAELRADIQKRLSRYVPDAVLSLDVRQVNSLVVYVIGKVNAPGRFVLNSNIEVLQALAAAGGVTPFAKQNRIKVFRHGEDETTIYPFEYDEVIGGRRLEQNIRLKRGDVVVVP